MVFIVLLNKVYAYDTQNIEVILLPLWDWKSASEVHNHIRYTNYRTMIQNNTPRMVKHTVIQFTDSVDFQSLWTINSTDFTQK